MNPEQSKLMWQQPFTYLIQASSKTPALRNVLE